MDDIRKVHIDSVKSVSGKQISHALPQLEVLDFIEMHEIMHVCVHMYMT